MDCWQHLDGAALPSRWWSMITGTSVPATCRPQPSARPPIPVEALEAIISGIQPAVVHSVSMVMELEDARSARSKARSDAAMDRAKATR